MSVLDTTPREADGAVLTAPAAPLVATHWGLYRARLRDGVAVALDDFEGDPAPSSIGAGLLASRLAPARILQPCVRRSFLEKGHAAGGAGRNAEPFVAVDWNSALDLVAGELARVRDSYGNAAIYGGSYGWASAGRFHHAQSQIHRFLNCIGGYVRSVQNYSYAAGDVILPHVIGSTRGLVSGHTPWRQIAGHARLIVMFGGAPARNAQVNAGGIARHGFIDGMRSCRDAGAGFVNISPIRDDALAELGGQWIAPRPNTDVALMLGLAHTLIDEGLYDASFLERYTTGFAQLRAYVMGEDDGVAKTPGWAAAIAGVEAGTIRDLARRMARERSFIMVAWALQRAEHGEQPYWMAIALAAMLGGIGLPGGGVGFGYASAGGIGNPPAPVAWPSLPQGRNPVEAFIPVARIADMLLQPGADYDYNGTRQRYPHARLIYWAGGNAFHHHQDLNKLVRAWQRPETIIVHDSWWNAQARHADIVLPATTFLERNDIACSNRDRFIAASHRLFAPPGATRSDYEIFRGLARRLGCEDSFAEGRDEADWIRFLYDLARQRARDAGIALPAFGEFWQAGLVELPEVAQHEPLLAAFRQDPDRNRLATPSGRIEIASQRIAGFGYPDCPGHPAWREPTEWLGAREAAAHPLHLLSNQPARKLHSQWDHGAPSREGKRRGREPIRLNPADATARGLGDGDLVRVFNDRGALLACVVVSDAIRPGVAQMATGAWYDPAEPGRPGALDLHGNPNVLTPDKGTSRLAQGPSPNSCLVQVEAFMGDAAPPRCFEPPVILAAPPAQRRYTRIRKAEGSSHA